LIIDGIHTSDQSAPQKATSYGQADLSCEITSNPS
jgi:hypothetical protein